MSHIPHELPDQRRISNHAVPETALRLPHIPTFAAAMQLSAQGVVLGKGTIIAPLTHFSSRGAKLQIEGNEERIFALLSVAYRKYVGFGILDKLESVSNALMRGNISRAAIMLCQTNFPRLYEERDAQAVDIAAWRLRCGVLPFNLLKSYGFLSNSGNTESFIKYNPAQPRDGQGRWTDSGSIELAATTKNFNYACKKLGLDPNDTSDAYHGLKRHMDLGGADNCVFDLENGDIFYNGEWIGNLFHL